MFQRVKSGVAAFVILGVAIGVLMAAIVLGSILAVLIIALVFLLIGVWFLSRMWRFKS
jgi:hypothetical protein